MLESLMNQRQIVTRDEIVNLTKSPMPTRPAKTTRLSDTQAGMERFALSDLPKIYLVSKLAALRTAQPVIDYDLSRRYPETWKAMERLVDSGKARSIGTCGNRSSPALYRNDGTVLIVFQQGLSNFNILKTRRILEVARIIPAVNQVELHPYLPQHELFEFLSKYNILLMAHQPLGGRPVPVVRGHPEQPFPTEDPGVRVTVEYEPRTASANPVSRSSK